MCIGNSEHQFLSPKFLRRQLLCSLVGHRRRICALSTVQDTMFVITGGKDCAIMVWNAEDGTHMSTLDGHSGLVRCLLPFHLEQDSGPVLQIASGSMDSTVKVSARSKPTVVN